MNKHRNVEEKPNGVVYCLDCKKKATSEEVLQRTDCVKSTYDKD